MISTWGIFWICFASVIILKTIIKRFFPVKMDDKQFERLKEITEIFSKNLSVNMAEKQVTEKKQKKK